MPEVARTLVKSPPELWAEVSDPESLARHLGEAGEIKITRLEPESTVVWEGDRIRGTVDLAPAGWGTKVTVTAEEVEGVAVAPPAEVEQEPEPEGPAEPEPQAAAEPVAEAEPEPVAVEAPKRRGFFARLFRRREEPAPEAVEPEVVAPEPEREPDVVAVVEPEPEPEAAQTTVPDTEAVLEGMLGSLGAAHHRPFSR